VTPFRRSRAFTRSRLLREIEGRYDQLNPTTNLGGQLLLGSANWEANLLVSEAIANFSMADSIFDQKAEKTGKLICPTTTEDATPTEYLF
jgi:hypothetical protein